MAAYLTGPCFRCDRMCNMEYAPDPNKPIPTIFCGRCLDDLKDARGRSLRRGLVIFVASAIALIIAAIKCGCFDGLFR